MAGAPGYTVRLFTFFYDRFGLPGLLMVPFFTMSTEKVVYDTFQAYRGHDIYTNGPREGTGAGFPSGGSLLPSFSLIAVRKQPVGKTE